MPRTHPVLTGMQKRHHVLTGYIAAFVLGAALVLQASETLRLDTAGKVLGVWSLTALTFQILLVTRMRWLEAGIGYDRITRWHAANGILILGLVLLHPPLMFAGLGLDTAEIPAYIQSTPTVLLGEIVLFLLIVQIVTTLYWTDLDYEHWRIVHRIGYVIVALGVLHSLLVGTTITVPPENLLSAWWLLLVGTAAGSVAYRYGYRPLRTQHRFTVADVRQETHDVHTVDLQPVDEDIDHEPGQFAFVTFHSDQVPAEEHHFTISSAPERDGFTYTIKAVGDFTGQIGELEEGDTAVVEGPYGAFTLDPDADRVVMVAGGIGITPFMSMLRHMDRTGDAVETHLFYGNQTVDDIVFKDELAELDDAHDWLTVTHVLSDEDVDGYEHGYIDASILTDLPGDAAYYVCGPPPMMDAVTDTLTDLGVDSSQIRTERFSLRDINLRRMLSR